MAAVMVTACAGKKKGKDIGEFPSAGSEMAASVEPDGKSGTDDGNETMSDEEFKKMLADMSETLGEDYSIAAVENEAGEVDYKFVPTRFAVYTDGEVHHLMYGANELTYMYGDFVNTSLPEYRVLSISLPTSLVWPEKGNQVLDKDDMKTRAEMEAEVLYDTSARYSTENVKVYSSEDRTCLFRAWSVPYTDDPTSIDKDIMHSFYTQKDKMYGFSNTEWNVDQLADGSYRYSTLCFLRDYADDSAHNAFARYTIIINDGRAYCYLVGSYNPQDAYWLDTYILQHSFVFQ